MLLNALIRIKENKAERIAQRISEMFQENGLECTVETHEIVESNDRKENRFLKLLRKKCIRIFAEDPNSKHNICATAGVKDLSKKYHKNDNIWHIKYGIKLIVSTEKYSRKEAEEELQSLISRYRYDIPIQNDVQLTFSQMDIYVNIDKRIRCFNMTTKQLIDTIKDLQTLQTQ